MIIDLTGNFLKAEDCKGDEIVTFIDAGVQTEITTPEKTVKKVLNFTVDINVEEKVYTPNKTALTILVEAFGDDTEKWVGKQFKITLIKVNVFGAMKNSIVPEPLKEDVKPEETNGGTVRV